MRRAKAAKLPADYGPRATAIVADSVYPALDRQITLVTRLRATARADVGLWAISNGDALYATALANATTTDFTAGQVHQMGPQDQLLQRHIEGWALYAEQLANESGIYKSDPLGEIGFYQSLCPRLPAGGRYRRASQALEPQEGDRLHGRGDRLPASARDERDQPLLHDAGPGVQLQLGHVSWLRARAKAKAILEPRFELNRFHQIVRDGAVPLVILDRLSEECARSSDARA